jgi:Rod binding domain-containing protein
VTIDPSRAAGLPPVPETALPADVRKGTTAQKQAYRAALGFEQMLVSQLTSSMLATAQAGGAGSADTGSGDAASGDSSSADTGATDPGSSMYQQMLPDQLAQAVTADGGIGLARQLYKSMETQR